MKLVKTGFKGIMPTVTVSKHLTTQWPILLWAQLTPMEFRVCCKLAEGKHPRDVAEELGLTPAMVKLFSYRAFKKLGLNSRYKGWIAKQIYLIREGGFMKNRIFALLAIAFLAGCARGQQTVTPPQYTAPVAGNGAYTPLNPNGSPAITGLGYTDTPAAGESCYVIQGYLAATAQTSAWSNTACSTPGTTGKIVLAWTCMLPNPNPQNYTCSQSYIVSRAAAVVAAGPMTPVQGTPTSAELEKKQGPALALAAVGQ
jgi:DNA-binding CsgD family transcriptional regulator